jgi:hypothetical protein
MLAGRGRAEIAAGIGRPVAMMLRWRQDYPDDRPPTQATVIFAVGHVWTAPAVQEESDYQRSVRVQPCIRPLNAAVWLLALM